MKSNSPLDDDVSPQVATVGVQGNVQRYTITESGFRSDQAMTSVSYGQPKRAHPVYEVVSGQPTWGRLYRLASETTAHLAVNSIVRAIKTEGRCSIKCEKALAQLSNHLNTELPAAIVRDVLNLCLSRDRFRCHHNPTDCLALELWRVFYNPKFTDINVVHHEFAFPKTTNYPDIVQNLEHLFSLVSDSLPNPPTTSEDSSSNNSKQPGDHNLDSGHEDTNKSNYNHRVSFCKRSLKCNGGERSKLGDCNEVKNIKSKNRVVKNNLATISSFKLELKHCEVGCFLQDRVVLCVTKLADGLRFLEIPGLGSDELLHVIGKFCTHKMWVESYRIL